MDQNQFFYLALSCIKIFNMCIINYTQAFELLKYFLYIQKHFELQMKLNTAYLNSKNKFFTNKKKY